MNNTLKNISFCEFCKKLAINKDNYTIYRIGFNTNKTSYNIGIKNIEDKLNKYLVKKVIHLSATQVMIYRPDVLLEYLRYKYNEPEEEVLNTYLFGAKICTKCFEKYVKEIPLR